MRSFIIMTTLILIGSAFILEEVKDTVKGEDIEGPGEEVLHINITGDGMNSPLTVTESENYFFISFWGKYPPNGGILQIYKNNFTIKDTIAKNNDDHRMVQVTEDERYLYYADYYGDRIVKFNLTSMSIERTLENQDWPSEILLSRNESYLYFGDCSGDFKSSSYLAILDVNNWEIENIRTYSSEISSLNIIKEEGIMFGRDQEGRIHKLDSWTLQILDSTTLDTALNPLNPDSGTSGWLKMNPDRSELWFVDMYTPKLWILDPEDLSVKRILEMDRSNLDRINFSPTSPVASVGTKTRSDPENPWNNITFIDTETYEILGEFCPGPDPYMAYYTRDREWIAFTLSHKTQNTTSFYRYRIGNADFSDMDLSGEKNISIQLPDNDGKFDVTYRMDEGPSWLRINGTILEGMVPGKLQGNIEIRLTMFNPFFESRKVGFNITFDSPGSAFDQDDFIGTISDPVALITDPITGDVGIAAGNNVLVNGEPVDGHDGAIADLSFSPGGVCIASVTKDGKFHVHDLMDDQRIWDIVLPESTCIDVSPNGSLVAIGHENGYITIMDLFTGEYRSYHMGGQVIDIIFDGGAGTPTDYGGDLLHVLTGGQMITLDAHEMRVISSRDVRGGSGVESAPEGLIIFGENGILHEPSRSIADMVREDLSHASVNGDWMAIVTKSNRNIVYLFNDDLPVDILQLPANITCMEWSPKGGKLYVGHEGGYTTFSRWEDDLPLVIDELPSETLTREMGPVYLRINDKIDIEGNMIIGKDSILSILGNGRLILNGNINMRDGSTVVCRGYTKMEILGELTMSDSFMILDSSGIRTSSIEVQGTSFRGIGQCSDSLVIAHGGDVLVEDCSFRTERRYRSLFEVTPDSGNVNIRGSTFLSDGLDQCLLLRSNNGIVSGNVLIETTGASLRVTGSDNRVFRNSFHSHVSLKDTVTDLHGEGNIFFDEGLVGNQWINDPDLGRSFPLSDIDDDGIGESYLPFGKMENEGFSGDIFPIIQGVDPMTVVNLDPPTIEISEDITLERGDEINVHVNLVNWNDIPQPEISWEMSNGIEKQGEWFRYFNDEYGQFTLNVTVDTGFGLIYRDGMNISVPQTVDDTIEPLTADFAASLRKGKEGEMEPLETIYVEIDIINTGETPINLTIDVFFDTSGIGSFGHRFKDMDTFENHGGSISDIPDDSYHLESGSTETIVIMITAPNITENSSFNVIFQVRCHDRFDDQIVLKRELVELHLGIDVLKYVDQGESSIFDDDDGPVTKNTDDFEPENGDHEDIPMILLLIPVPFILVVITLFSLAILTEEGRWKAAALVPLKFASIKEKENDSMNRMKTIDLTFSNPGISITQVSEKLDISYSTAQYHLRNLVKEGVIRTIKDGRLRRFYPTIGRPEGVLFEVTDLQWKILDVIRSRPGISQSEIAREISDSRQKVNFHVRALSQNGLIRMTNEGGRSLCFPEHISGGKVIKR